MLLGTKVRDFGPLLGGGEPVTTELIRTSRQTQRNIFGIYLVTIALCKLNTKHISLIQSLHAGLKAIN